jgi:CheY-like chemotaxis protein
VPDAALPRPLACAHPPETPVTTILVVDDDPTIADILRIVLEEEGYRVVTARDGLEGLARLADARPDLVLCDVMMPGLDGRDVYRRMQAMPAYRSIPVVLMSAAAKPFPGGDFQRLAFLVKPFEIDVLLAIITRLLDAARLDEPPSSPGRAVSRAWDDHPMGT